jgi:hypothetical protein
MPVNNYWFAGATDIGDDLCPVMNGGPTEAEYYALMATEDAAKIKAQPVRAPVYSTSGTRFVIRDYVRH